MSWDIFPEKEHSHNIDEFYAKLKKNNILGRRKKTPFLLAPAFWSERKNGKPFMLTHGWTLRWDTQNRINLSYGKPSECPGFPQRELHISNTFVAGASVSLSFLSLTCVLSFEEVSSTVYMVVHKVKARAANRNHTRMHTLHQRRRVPIRPEGASNSHSNKVTHSCRTGV